jgi:colicin import membrane protein
VKAPRPGIVFSGTAHAAILAYAIIGFTSKPFDVAPTEALPIDIITPQEFDALTKGSKTSKVVAPPKIQATKVAEAPPEPKPEQLPEAKTDVVPPPPPPAPHPEPKLAEQPKPEPPKPQPKLADVPQPAPRPPEPKHEPPKPAPKLAELPKPEPKPEPPKPEPKLAEQKKPPPPKPAEPKVDPIKAELEKTRDMKPERRKVETAKAAPPSQEKPVERKFDLNKIAALADRREPTRTASIGPQLASASTAGIPTGNAPKLSLSERSRIDGLVSDQVRPRWSPPIGALSAQDLQVRVRFSLGPDGSLIGMPTIVNRGSNPLFQAAADAAVRAVRMAAPLKGLPQQSYDYWREVEITFDPRDMAGG